MSTIYKISLVLLIPVLLEGQKTIRPYIGANLTNVKDYYFDYGIKNDSFTRSYDWLIRYSIGFDYEIKVSNKVAISSGLGISIMGAGNYFKYISGIDTLNDYIGQSMRENPHLKIVYLRFPLIIKYKLNKSFYIFGGYSLNFSIRKNQNFSWPPYLPPTYNKYQHYGIIGFEKQIDNLSLMVNYCLPLSKISDSKDYYEDYSYNQKLYGLQFSIGYLIFE